MHPSSRYLMLFPRDGIKNILHKEVQQEDEMVNPEGRNLILDRGTVKHTLEGDGISDSSVTLEQFRGLADRAEEWNFESLQVNTVTTMGALRAIAFCVGMLLYCLSSKCWRSIWRALT